MTVAANRCRQLRTTASLWWIQRFARLGTRLRTSAESIHEPSCPRSAPDETSPPAPYPAAPVRADPRTRRAPRRRCPPARSTERSEEHTSELQSHSDLVCRLLLEKKKTIKNRTEQRRTQQQRPGDT